MTEVGIQHHGVLFTFEVKDQWAGLKDALVYDEREAQAYYPGPTSLENAGRRLFNSDEDFRHHVLWTARIRERAQTQA